MGTAALPVIPLVIGLVFGVLTRLLTLKVDYRQYPGYPAGYTSHLTMGFIAAFIGAIAVPALIAKEYTAATFLALAAQQFGQIRAMERDTLRGIEAMALVPRGAEYIEGIARTFEQRNYLTMGVALVASSLADLAPWWTGLIGGGVALILALTLKSGQTIGNLIQVRSGNLRFDRTLLYVDDIMVMEVGLPGPRQRYLESGLGVILEPKNPLGQAVLWDLSQRQAIVHDAVAVVGVQKDVGYPEETPICRMEMPNASGRAAMSIIPVEKDMGVLLEAIKRTPVLESTKANPIVSKYLRSKNVQGGG